jgi:hypothetical protein
VAANYIRVESVFELSSDHSPIVATVGVHVLSRAVPPPTLITNHTNWNVFSVYITARIDLNLRITQVVSWTTRRTTSLPFFRTPLGTPLTPPLLSTAATLSPTNAGAAAGGNDRETRVIAPFTTA